MSLKPITSPSLNVVGRGGCLSDDIPPSADTDAAAAVSPIGGRHAGIVVAC